MSEQAPQIDPGLPTFGGRTFEEFKEASAVGMSQKDRSETYQLEYPNAVVDPVKAELMAYASKENEEKFVQYKKGAIGFAEEAAKTVDFEVDQRLLDAAEKQVKRAQRSRRLADEQAQIVGDIYDKVEQIK